MDDIISYTISYTPNLNMVMSMLNKAFKKDLKVTIQDIGYGHDNRYIPQESQIATTAFWYQTEPHNAFPPLPEAEILMAE